jgi:hypothetical protein
MGVPGGTRAGFKVTVAPPTFAGSLAWNGASIRTSPVNQLSGPFLEGCEPLRIMFISVPLNMTCLFKVAQSGNED